MVWCCFFVRAQVSSLQLTWGWTSSQLPPKPEWVVPAAEVLRRHSCLFFFFSQEIEQEAAVKNTWDDGGRLLPQFSRNQKRAVWLFLRPQMVVLGGDGELSGVASCQCVLSHLWLEESKGGGVFHSLLLDASILIFIRDLFSADEKEKRGEKRMHLPSVLFWS